MNEMQDQPRLSALIYKIAQTGHMVDHMLDAALEQHGLSIAKLGVLRRLAEANGPITLGQLAERLACVKSNVTQLVDRLEAEGLAKRVPDPDDRRSVRAAITDKGRHMYELGMRAQAEVEQTMLSSLSLDDQAELASLLERFSHVRVH